MTSIPSAPGSYALLLRLEAPARITIGRLGEMAFPAGAYVYTGSAFGPGGLAARLRHHLTPALPRPHWHIDFLRTRAAVVGQAWRAAERCECAWSRRLIGLGGQAIAPRFGASDCRDGCPAHLVYFVDPIQLTDLAGWLAPVETGCPSGAPLRW